MATAAADIAGQEQLVLNGVDALTGGPLFEPQPLERVVRTAAAEFERTTPEDRGFVQSLSEIKLNRDFGMDVDNLGDPVAARWGLIVPAGEAAFMKQALQPLIEHRARQLGVAPQAVPVFEVAPDTEVVTFLRNNGVERGIGVVAKVPYYLLIAGDPQKIPFRFQSELNTEYATGRLHFDAADGYAAYAERLVTYEQAAAIPNRREAVFWAPTRDVDPATSKSAPQLARPLYDNLDPQLGFDKRLYYGEGGESGAQPASKDNLRAVLSGGQPPALLFTASHGLGYRSPHELQAEQQGALMAQEYVWGRPVAREQWYGAQDLRQDGADVTGLVHFAFACFGAGTPRFDDYAPPDVAVPVIAERPFIAALPRQMAAQGALAFVGHVDRAWGYSFMGAQALQQGGITPREAFQRALARILRGGTIAHALRDEYDRGVHLSSSLLEKIGEMRRNIAVPALTLARLWTERNDARSYVLVGDPAARLRVDVLGKNPAPVIVRGFSAPRPPAANSASAVASSTPAAAAPAPANGNPVAAFTAAPAAPGATPAAPAASAPASSAGTSAAAQAAAVVAASAAAAAKAAAAAAGVDERDTDFTPLLTTGGANPKIDKELQQAWADYIKNGFKQNNTMFQRVLSAFIVPYWLTVAMYVGLFLFGLTTFGLMLYLATQQKVEVALAFGGLSVVAFLGFFISRPLRALEQNIVYITWLGVIYNTYWSQLMNAVDPKTIRGDLEKITARAIRDLNYLAVRHEAFSGKLPDLPKDEDPAPGDDK